ncbi:5'-Nucleotidase domain-containing protein [Clostridium sp. DL-VIII]|nr:5'-Nucleotidase domain-containing protein [Clostridium sp. DL-VIII]
MRKEKKISILLIVAIMLSNFVMFVPIKVARADVTNYTNNVAVSDISDATTGAAATVTTGPAVSTKNLDIIEITDFHGQLLDTKNNEVGAALANSVENAADTNSKNTLIIGGGDLYQGTPISNLSKGVPVQKVLSKMGMEVTALGNHEFDWGLDTINNETMQGAGYEIVCSNLHNRKDDTRPYKPYKIIEKDGTRIAVIGAILNDVPTIVLPANIANYKVTDAAEEINSCAKKIRDNNEADVVLAVVHDGENSLDNIISNLHGVDAVFGGHTHTIEDKVVKDADNKDVPKLNACNAGKGYIDLKISLDENNKIIGFSKKCTNWNGVTVNSDTPVDKECKEIVDEANADLAPIFKEILGSDDVDYTSEQNDNPFGESQLGDWMADVVKNNVNADVGMVNNGGIRLSPIPKGNITLSTIFYLMPFDNTITTVNMTGAQLKNLIEQAIADNTGKGLQVSGIKITYDSSKPSYVKAVTDSDGKVITPEVPGQRVKSIAREKDGTTIKDDDKLTVAAPDFVATGGDNFTEFTLPEIKNTYVDTHTLVRDALIQDVKKNGKIVVNLDERIKNDTDSAGSPVETTINGAKALASQGTLVKVTGYVSGVNGKTVFLQDNPANPTAGIVVYNTCGAKISNGDKITTTGKLSIYNGLTEITPSKVSDVTTVSNGNTIIPKEVTIGDINDDLQGELIKIKNAAFKSIDTTASSIISDSTGSIAIYKMPVIAGLKANDVKDVTANVSKYNTFELIVTDPSEIADPGSSQVGLASTISILATSDIHGNVLNFDYGTNKAPAKGQGLAKVSTYVNNVRASNPNVMLVDDGDTIQGTPLSYYYDMIDKNSFYPMAKVMGAMKYDTETLGNHEFNYGLETLNRVINDYKSQGIHVLSANTYENDGSNYVEPYYIKAFNINGKSVKVGILGLTTKCIPNWEDPEHYKGLHFNDLVDEAKKWVPVVKGKGADIVIVTAHSGEEGASDVIPENQIKAIATGVSGIDAIVAGHAHSVINDTSLKNPDGKVVPVVEPGKWGNYVSQIDISIDGNNNLSGIKTKNVAMDNTIAEDPNIVSLIEPYQEKTLDYTATVIGQATDAFSGDGQTTNPTAIMELINKIQAQTAQAQLSIAAPLSSSANIPKGNITIKDIMGTYVYENYLYGIKMNGAQLKKWMEYSMRYYKQAASKTDLIEKDPVLNVPDYNLDQLYGATYDVDLTKPVGNRIVNLKYNGKTINDTDIFTVAINDYRYNGGGGFMQAAGISNTDPSIVTYSSAKALGDDGQVRSLMMSYIKAGQIISPTCSNNWKLYTENVPINNTGSNGSSGDSNNTGSSSSGSHHHSSSSDSNDDNTSNTSSNSNNSSSNSNNSGNNNVQTGQNNNVSKNNWSKISGKWYYLNDQGTKIVNTWKQINNQWYHFGKDGIMETGWLKDSNGKWYYLQENGAMKTGWLLDKDNNWYYLNNDGSMTDGWFEDSDGKWYYFGENGVMAKDEYIGDYYVNENGEYAA